MLSIGDRARLPLSNEQGVIFDWALSHTPANGPVFYNHSDPFAGGLNT